MISIRSPGKIVKCGWSSNIFAAASCEPARTTVKAPISLAMWAIPFESTFLVLPSGPPMATIAAWCFSTQAFHAAIPCCSLTRRSASGSAFQAAIFALVLLPRKTARNVSLALMRFSSLAVLLWLPSSRLVRIALLQFVKPLGRLLHLLGEIGHFLHLADLDDLVP